jgi:hypothetical protein
MVTGNTVTPIKAEMASEAFNIGPFDKAYDIQAVPEDDRFYGRADRDDRRSSYRRGQMWDARVVTGDNARKRQQCENVMPVKAECVKREWLDNLFQAVNSDGADALILKRPGRSNPLLGRE